MEMNVFTSPGYLISLAGRGFARLGEKRLKSVGFGLGYLPVLVALRDGHASTQRDLAHFVKVEQPPMAQMLARMERDGLIKRTPDPSDGRSRRVTLTSEAEKRLPEGMAVLRKGNRAALKGFSDDEAIQFIDMLDRVITNLDGLATEDSLSEY